MEKSKLERVMEKSKLERFINKYNLGGSCESVILSSNGNSLSVRSISDDKNVLIEASVDNINFPMGEFGVFETKKLRSILNVLDDTLAVSIILNNAYGISGLSISDNSTKATFVLADPTVIPVVPELKKIPPMELTIQLDEKFVNTFVKAKSALNDVETFAVISDGESSVASVVIGHSSLNTNRISISTQIDSPAKMAPINFSANYLREILVANKEIKTGTLEVSSKGIAVIKFNMNDFIATYYLVQITG
jgi:hypothetical protein